MLAMPSELDYFHETAKMPTAGFAPEILKVASNGCFSSNKRNREKGDVWLGILVKTELLECTGHE